MKRYQIVIDGTKTNEYIRGRISGIIYVLIGMPEQGYAWRKVRRDIHWVTRFDATVDQQVAVVDVINKVYPGVILSITVIE